MKRVFLSAMLTLAIGKTVRADDAADAQALLEEGTRLFTEEADYVRSLGKFKASFERRPTWKALNGMGLAYIQLGKVVEALDTYERLLFDFGPALSATQRQTVEKRTAELAEDVGTLVLEILEPDTRVLIDGEVKAVGSKTMRLRLMKGAHSIVATREKHIPLTKNVTIVAEQELIVRVELEPESVQVVVIVKEVEWRRPMPKWVPWSAVGLGATFLGTSLGLFYSAEQDFETFDDLVTAAAGELPIPVEVDDSARTRGETKLLLGKSFLAAGGLGIGVGLLLIGVNRPQPVAKPEAFILVPTANGIGVRTSF